MPFDGYGQYYDDGTDEDPSVLDTSTITAASPWWRRAMNQATIAGWLREMLATPAGTFDTKTQNFIKQVAAAPDGYRMYAGWPMEKPGFLEKWWPALLVGGLVAWPFVASGVAAAANGITLPATGALSAAGLTTTAIGVAPRLIGGLLQPDPPPAPLNLPPPTSAGFGNLDATTAIAALVVAVLLFRH